MYPYDPKNHSSGYSDSRGLARMSDPKKYINYSINEFISLSMSILYISQKYSPVLKKGYNNMSKQSQDKHRKEIEEKKKKAFKNNSSNNHSCNSSCNSSCKNASREGIGDGDPHGYSKK